MIYGPLKTQISLGFWAGAWQNLQNHMSAQWRLRSACASAYWSLIRAFFGILWVAKDRKLLHIDREDWLDCASVQTNLSLTVCTYHFASFFVLRLIWKTNEPPHDETNKMACAPSEDTDQTWHPPSLIRVFAVHMKKAWVLSYPLSAQRRLWSDWADAQADLSLCWAHSHFVGFVLRWLNYVWYQQYWCHCYGITDAAANQKCDMVFIWSCDML